MQVTRHIPADRCMRDGGFGAGYLARVVGQRFHHLLAQEVAQGDEAERGGERNTQEGQHRAEPEPLGDGHGHHGHSH